MNPVTKIVLISVIASSLVAGVTLGAFAQQSPSNLAVQIDNAINQMVQQLEGLQQQNQALAKENVELKKAPTPER